MDKKEILDAAKYCLEFNKDFESCIVASDGSTFADTKVGKNAAHAHAQKLTNTKLVTVQRSEVFPEEKAEVEEGFSFDEMSVEELQKFAQDNEIELQTEEKEEMIDEIVEALDGRANS